MNQNFQKHSRQFKVFEALGSVLFFSTGPCCSFPPFLILIIIKSFNCLVHFHFILYYPSLNIHTCLCVYIYIHLLPALPTSDSSFSTDKLGNFVSCTSQVFWSSPFLLYKVTHHIYVCIYVCIIYYSLFWVVDFSA